jgi:hypothetical protein
MNSEYITKRAKKFTHQYVTGGVSDYEKVIQETKTEINGIDNNLDKVNFLRIVLEDNEIEYQRHLKDECTNISDCGINYDHESIAYYLTQELNQYGIRTDNDQFTTQEKVEMESKLDQILKNLQDLKDGQQVIYEDLTEEINKLRELYILGKKTWFQLLLGKTQEMVVGGIISETVSKEIVERIGPEVMKLIA